MYTCSILPVFLILRIEQLILEHFVRRDAVATVDESHTASSDRLELDLSDLLEQVGSAHLHIRVHAFGIGRHGMRGRMRHIEQMIAMRLVDVLDGVRHGKHRVDDEVYERVLRYVELLFARAQATRR